MPKYDKDSEVWVERIIQTIEDEEGKVIKKITRWEKLKRNLDLGTLKEPKNTDVITIETRIKPPSLNDSLLSSLLGSV